jgi:hypothetical protein
VAVVGAAALARGLVGIAVPSIGGRDFLVTPVCIGVGTLFSLYAAWLWPRSVPTDRQRGFRVAMGLVSAPMRVLAGLIIVMSLFWATTEYAQAVGRGLADSLVRNLGRRPAVVVYSKNPLLLEPPVRLDQLQGPVGSYRYRYSGLRLLTESAGRIILLPDDWSRNRGPAIVLEETSLRLELYPGFGYWK